MYKTHLEQDERGRIELVEIRVKEKVEKEAEKKKLDIAKKLKLAGVAPEIISNSTKTKYRRD